MLLLESALNLQRLAEDFVKAAEEYGRIIISEFDPKIWRYTDEQVRSIPLRCEICSNLYL